MKAIKIYLVVVTVLLVGAIGAGVYVWYMVQNMNRSIEQGGANAAQPIGAPQQPVTTEAAPTQPATIKTSELTETQQSVLKSFGYEDDSFTVTPTMMQCAENAVGKERLDAIVSGAAPGPLEAAKLFPCFKK